jgi:prenylcysteine oxidase/farnesylcysteine lyase
MVYIKRSTLYATVCLLLGISHVAVSDATFRVAVVGGGIAGCASSYYLRYPDQELTVPDELNEKISKIFQHTSSKFPIEITVYEASPDGMGGRVRSRLFPKASDAQVQSNTTSEPDEQEYVGVDLGASIFIRDNRRVYQLAKKFELPITDRPMTDKRMKSSTGLWDGESFRWILEDHPWYSPSGWWKKLKLGWRYGFRTPSQMHTLVRKFVEQFGNIYGEIAVQGWRSVHELAERLNMTEYLNQTARTYLVDEVGMNAAFVDEFVNAATRVNYGIDVDKIHALAGLVSLAPVVSDTLAIDGGNQQLVREMCLRSAARMRYGKRVVALKQTIEVSGEHCEGFILQRDGDTGKDQQVMHTQHGSGCRSQWQVITEDGQYDVYDAVIMAAPLDLAKLNEDGYQFDVAPVKYKELHVTIVQGHLHPEYFGKDVVSVPTSVMTHGEHQPEFISLSQLALAPPLKYSILPIEVEDVTMANKENAESKSTGESLPTLVKFFSDAPLTDEVLSRIFYAYDVKSIDHTLFHSYPLMIPENAKADRRVEIAPGVWYVNGMEPFISTMETETIAAANVARMVRRWAMHVLEMRDIIQPSASA